MVRFKEPKKVVITVVIPGSQPPCIEQAPGQCRGCFGWEQMLEAARSGHPLWRGTPIRCDCTGLTVVVAPAKKGQVKNLEEV